MADNPPMVLTVVLVAEDEALIRMFTAGFLIEAGYTVVEASNAAEAITELESDAKVRVLLTDVEMPGDMDGLELAREVQRRWPDVVIIVTSGRVRPHRDDLAGAEFFQKPLREKAVVETIRERLSM
jgi:two-component system, response regulator PdtaR